MAAAGLKAICLISYNDGNAEAMRDHIGTIMGLLQDHASSTKVMEAELTNVICIISITITITIILSIQ